MIPHLQIEKELNSGELIDLTPGLFSAGCSTGTALRRKAA
jgi:LysR family transcriptional regulator (chromosome initiation inhibitor)